jgi:hypothetical protein
MTLKQKQVTPSERKRLESRSLVLVRVAEGTVCEEPPIQDPGHENPKEKGNPEEDFQAILKEAFPVRGEHISHKALCGHKVIIINNVILR